MSWYYTNGLFTTAHQKDRTRNGTICHKDVFSETLMFILLLLLLLYIINMASASMQNEQKMVIHINLAIIEPYPIAKAVIIAHSHAINEPVIYPWQIIRV